MSHITKILTVVQARTGSSRFPGKVLKPILGKPNLLLMLDRVSKSELYGTLVVATTTEIIDDPIEKLCKDNNLNIFRGHSTDLLDRHYQAAKIYDADAVVKIPSDCPLIDPKIIDKVLRYYVGNMYKYDFVSNLHPATYPDGNDVEIISMDALENAWENSSKDFEREHTTPYFWENPDKFKIGNVKWETGRDFSMTHRFTLDYPEDYEFIKRVYEELYHKNSSFDLNDILKLLDEKPEIKNINEKYAGVNWYRHHLNDLKTVSKEQTKFV